MVQVQSGVVTLAKGSGEVHVNEETTASPALKERKKSEMY